MPQLTTQSILNQTRIHSTFIHLEHRLCAFSYLVSIHHLFALSLPLADFYRICILPIPSSFSRSSDSHLELHLIYPTLARRLSVGFFSVVV